MKNLSIKAYVKGKSLMANQRGSQSLEWIGIAAIVVIVTGLISTAFKGSGLGGTFFSKFSEFINEVGKIGE